MARAVHDDVIDENGVGKRFRYFANKKGASLHRKIAFRSGSDSRRRATSKKKDDFPKRGLDRQLKVEGCYAKKRPCRRESRPRAFRNRSISRTFENRTSRAFSARFDDRNRFEATNKSSRNFERSETLPESVEKRRFPKRAPTRKKGQTLS